MGTLTSRNYSVVGSLVLPIRFILNNDLKEMALERGMEVERSTICRWMHEQGIELAKRVKSYLKNASDSWQLDETYLKIKGKGHYLYRTIDKTGQTLDWMLSRYRNAKSAKRFF